MIGVTGGAILFSFNVFLACLLGIGISGLTCLVLRRSWGIKAALVDAVLAAVVAVASAYVISAIESARGIWESDVALILAIAGASVLVRHLISVARRSAN